MNEEHRLTPQEKPKKTLNYHEKVRLGLILVGMKRTALNKISKKHKKELDLYAQAGKLDDEILICEECGSSYSKEELDKHHPYGRGKYIEQYTYTRKTLHALIHAKPDKAYELGFLQPEYRGLSHNPNHPIPFKLNALSCCGPDGYWERSFS